MWDDLWQLEGDQDPDLDDERVLVVVVPSLRDWDIICREHWYRIPLARAPQRIGAEYLAFYHPKVFQDLRWTISYYAPVRRYRVLPRRELLPAESHHPRANALYYRIELGTLESLVHPIPSHRLRRVTFVMTTLARLLRAREINDLWLQEPPGRRYLRALELREAGGAYLSYAAAF